MRRVVVTGMGMVTPIGNTVEENWAAVKAGKCGIAPITYYDTADRQVTLAGEVKDLDVELYMKKKEVRKMDGYTKFAMISAIQAFEDAGLSEIKEDRSRWGVCMASGIGGISTIETEQVRGMEKGFDRVSPHFIPMAISNMAAGNIAIRFGLHGSCTAVVTACASAANAIGEAFRHIRDGYGDLMLAGGAESSITPLSIGGFTSLQALSTASEVSRASIPFDKERSGFVMGEGAGALILEEYEHAKARGAHIYGELVGYATNCDAHHVTAPAPNGEYSAVCMQLALADAGLQPEDIDYINAHGTSTHLNDMGETAAVKTVFGDHARKLAMSSTKSMTGHLLGASAAVEAIYTVKAIQDDFLPATINYQVPDEDCDLDIVPNEGRNCVVRAAMSNSLGFGGHNASLVFKKFAE
ncbi:MAG: beta-ketoacyl-ACP synthase II [Lachnospiraceae bacterium]|nr:beta-ketoacyl-ACP synthase II [Lachnospiraceae bacterium]